MTNIYITSNLWHFKYYVMTVTHECHCYVHLSYRTICSLWTEKNCNDTDKYKMHVRGFERPMFNVHGLHERYTMLLDLISVY